MANEMRDLQQTTGTNDQGQKSCRVFVSYSHKDSAAAQQFIQFFRLELQGASHLGIKPDQVFFDRDNLLAGEEWDESIQCALEQADYFIFLVSANSLTSKYCYERELWMAASNKLPILPIVLDYCPWDTQPIPGDRQQRKLGDLGALPKDSNFSLKPITAWAADEQGLAWTGVVKGITKTLFKGKPQTDSVAEFNTQNNNGNKSYQVDTLLPYFCNQNKIVNKFNRDIQAWQHNVLLVLVKGINEDNVSRFWERLHNKDLSDYLDIHNTQVTKIHPFKWRLGDGVLCNTEDMMRFLSDSISNHQYRLHDSCSEVISLEAILPKGEKIETQSHNIRSLLELFERRAQEIPLNRLVLAILIEDEALIKLENLMKFLNLTGYQRTTIIELEPLETIDQEDVRIWHQQERERLGTIDEEKLLADIFADSSTTPLRMKPFAKKINEFLSNIKR